MERIFFGTLGIDDRAITGMEKGIEEITLNEMWVAFSAEPHIYTQSPCRATLKMWQRPVLLSYIYGENLW